MIKFLEEKEVRKIIDSIPDDTLRDRRDKAILETLFCTGLRLNELLSLKRADILKGNPLKTLELAIVGKGGWTGIVYFSSRVLKIYYSSPSSFSYNSKFK